MEKETEKCCQQQPTHVSILMKEYYSSQKCSEKFYKRSSCLRKITYNNTYYSIKSFKCIRQLLCS